MVRLGRPFDHDINGQLLVSVSDSPSVLDVYYIPPPIQVEAARIHSGREIEDRVKILEIDNLLGCLSMFPINTFGDKSGYLRPKYKKVHRITLAFGTPVIDTLSNGTESDDVLFNSITFGPTEPLPNTFNHDEVKDISPPNDQILEILESLPSAFIKDYDFGLGFTKSHRYILHAIEEISDCTEIYISKDCRTEVMVEKGVFSLALSDFETLRKSLQSTTNMSRSAAISVNSTNTYNYLAEKVGKPSRPVRMGRHHYRKLFTQVLQNNGEVLSDVEQEEVLGAISKNMRVISETRTGKLAQLQKDIELVNLEGLIVKYKRMMTATHDEEDWQQFFSSNPFILSLAFGHPVVKVQDKAFVGGHTLSGKGSNITDFLVKNNMTNNTAIVEIKTPNTGLLNKSKYRGGVFVPSAQLTGAINQTLHQKYTFEKNIIQVKDDSEIYDLKSYSVHCCLIIGTLPKEKPKQKSFEIYRGNSKDVVIITYDEMLEKLRSLHAFLTSPNHKLGTKEPTSDLPF